MANENTALPRMDQESVMLDNRLFESNSTVPIMADREALRTEFIVFGSILTVLFVFLLLTLAAFAVYVRRRRPSVPTSPIPPSPPEIIRVSNATFTIMDEDSSIYEPIGNFSPLSINTLSKLEDDEQFTEVL